jgi:hypothetical protein
MHFDGGYRRHDGKAEAFAEVLSLLAALEEPKPKSGCQCQWEAGDSPCRVHGENEEEP